MTAEHCPEEPRLVGITDDDWGVFEHADGHRSCGPMPYKFEEQS